MKYTIDGQMTVIFFKTFAVILLDSMTGLVDSSRKMLSQVEVMTKFMQILK